ncbi:hypothetical protein C8J57DRAFT_1708652 [Mycena rebaudengoi]|nr:hypothetical protein C8J57DRAFT_1708652 [Mycena rebaudengoi]
MLPYTPSTKALPLLKTLKDAVAVSPFFDSLSLPVVERLTLHPLRRRTVSSVDVSATSDSGGGTAASFARANTPSLTELELNSCEAALDDQLLAALQLCDSDLSPLAPKLTTLCADVPQACFSESVLERTIRSRCWPATQAFAVPQRVARLDTVYLYLHEILQRRVLSQHARAAPSTCPFFLDHHLILLPRQAPAIIEPHVFYRSRCVFVGPHLLNTLFEYFVLISVWPGLLAHHAGLDAGFGRELRHAPPALAEEEREGEQEA